MTDDSQNLPDPCIEALKRLVRLNEGKGSPESPQLVAELALWGVPSTRQAIIEKGDFSPEEIRQLDELASEKADNESESIARHSARDFQPGVRFEDPEPEEKTKPETESE